MANEDPLVNDGVFHVRINARGKPEVSHDEHISIEDLRVKLQENTSIYQEFHKLGKYYELKILSYLSKQQYIPKYPTPVEFHVSEVTHVTNTDSLHKILESEGFKSLNEFSWWSLKIDDESIRAAEEHYLERIFPNRTQEQKERQETFLSKFTTSPAFQNRRSRYGNFKFTFSLTELMETYRNQMCGGQDPVLREYKTIFYWQEIMYVVLVHSPEQNEKFENFPEVKSNLFVSYKEDKIIWTPQAISQAHEFQLLLNKENKIAEIKTVSPQFYVWDHVSLAFDLNGVLKFPKGRLKRSLSFCEIDQINLTRGYNLSLKEAEKILQNL